MIDATIVRVSQYAAGALTGQANEAIGRSRGGLSTKVHCKIDALGYPLKIIISRGEKAEINYAKALVSNELCDYLFADR